MNHFYFLLFANVDPLFELLHLKWKKYLVFTREEPFLLVSPSSGVLYKEKAKHSEYLLPRSAYERRTIFSFSSLQVHTNEGQTIFQVWNPSSFCSISIVLGAQMRDEPFSVSFPASAFEFPLPTRAYKWEMNYFKLSVSCLQMYILCLSSYISEGWMSF